MITVFYDGSCSLCSREIRHYMRIAPSDTYSWVDISSTPEPLNKLGYTQEDGMRLLHAQDNDGTIQIGVAAFICIWKKLPYWRILAPIASAPIISPILDACYLKFANWRFKRRGFTCPI